MSKLQAEKIRDLRAEIKRLKKSEQSEVSVRKLKKVNSSLMLRIDELLNQLKDK